MAHIGEGEIKPSISSVKEPIREGKTLEQPMVNKEGTEFRPTKDRFTTSIDSENESKKQEKRNIKKAGLSLTNGMRKFAVSKLPFAYKTTWKSSDENIIFLGEYNGPHISLANADGEMEITLSLGANYDYIAGGLEVSRPRREYAVIAYDGKNKLRRLSVISLSPTLEQISSSLVIDTVAPKSVFDLDDDYFGVFCRSPDRLELYKKNDKSLHRKIILDLPNPIPDSSRISVCQSKAGFAVTDCECGVVHIVDNTGELVEKIGSKSEQKFINVPGKLFNPKLSFYDCDGGLVVVCTDGAFHRYAKGEWDIQVPGCSDNYLWHCTIIGKKVYSVCEDELAIYKIRD